MTKRDLATDEETQKTTEQVKELVKGTFLENCPVCEVDSVSKRGIDNLIQMIDSESKKLKQKHAERDYRMNIDRKFNVKGIGTVVTGTLLDGDIHKGESFIYPLEKILILKTFKFTIKM